MAQRRRQARGGGGRPAQIGELLRQTIGSILEEGSIKDPRLTGAPLLTVTGVELAPDLKHARVFISVYTEDDEVFTRVIEGLRSAAGEFKRLVADRLALRYTPHLDFRPDGSIRRGAKIEALLKELRSEPGDGEGRSE